MSTKTLPEHKKNMEHESDSDTNFKWCARNNPKRLGKETGKFKDQRISEDHPDYSINEIHQNTKKSPGELRKLVVTQTPVKKPSANAGVKNSQRSKINYNNYNNLHLL